MGVACSGTGGGMAGTGWVGGCSVAVLRGIHEGMRIACPSCSAAYEVPGDRLPPGRGTRCARCGAQWVPVALEDGVPAVAVVVEEPRVAVVEVAVPVVEVAGVEAEEAAPARAAVVVRPERGDTLLPADVARPGRAVVVAGWVLSLVVLGGLGFVAVSQRGAIMRAWPPSARVYAAIGLMGGAAVAVGKVDHGPAAAAGKADHAPAGSH